jgi:hypothetical protein
MQDKEDAAANAIANLKAKIVGVKDTIVDKSKSLVDQVKGMTTSQKKKAAGVVVGVWGGATAVGWLANSASPAAPVKGKK